MNSNQNPAQGDGALLSQDVIDQIYGYEAEQALPVDARRILVCDDAPFMRMKLERLLTANRHTVKTVDSGEAAIEALSQESFDYLTLNIGMPGLNGFETLEIVRERFPSVKVIMLSAQAQSSNVKRAMEMGAIHFLSKPYSDQRLLECIL